jgi:hypothetical protein
MFFVYNISWYGIEQPMTRTLLHTHTYIHTNNTHVHHAHIEYTYNIRQVSYSTPFLISVILEINGMNNAISSVSSHLIREWN